MSSKAETADDITGLILLRMRQVMNIEYLEQVIGINIMLL